MFGVAERREAPQSGESAPDALYCPNCAAETRPVVCGDCRAVICAECGTPLERVDDLGIG